MFGGTASQSSTGNALGYRANTWNVQAGGQRQIAPGWHLGGTLAYESSQFRGDGAQACSPQLKDGDVEYLVDLLTSVGASYEVAVRDLPRDLVSVREARQFVRSTLEEWGASDAEDAALLVVSELVTNAITHARSDCRLQLSRTGAAVRIEVVDGGLGTPDPLPPTATGEHGRGMHIVSTLAIAWGTEQLDDGGKVVWADLPLSA